MASGCTRRKLRAPVGSMPLCAGSGCTACWRWQDQEAAAS